MGIRKPKTSAPVTPAPAARSDVKGSGTTARPATPRLVTHDMISKRAYDIYASRGFAPGNPQDDWLEAERQLRAGL